MFRRIADQDKSENAWIELVVKLSLTNQWETACRKYPDNQKMQRLFVLDQYVSCFLKSLTLTTVFKNNLVKKYTNFTLPLCM